MSGVEDLQDEIDWLTNRNKELTEALTNVAPYIPVYHWSPAFRHKQIVRYGLRPSMRATTSSGSMPYVCFADSPSWAWALSGDMRYSPKGKWDLWMTWLNHLTSPELISDPNRPSGIYEVRITHRLYKSKLWYVGSRIKE